MTTTSETKFRFERNYLKLMLEGFAKIINECVDRLKPR